MEILIILAIAAVVIGLIAALSKKKDAPKTIPGKETPPIGVKKDPPGQAVPVKKDKILYRYSPGNGNVWICRFCETENSITGTSCCVCHTRR